MKKKSSKFFQSVLSITLALSLSTNMAFAEEIFLSEELSETAETIQLSDFSESSDQPILETEADTVQSDGLSSVEKEAIDNDFLPDFAMEMEFTPDTLMKSCTLDAESLDTPFQSDALFSSYANQELGLNGNIETVQSYCGDHLTGTDAKVYKVLKKRIAEIANGSRTDTHIWISTSELGLPAHIYGSDLGIGKITSNPDYMTQTERQKYLDALLKYFNYHPIEVGWTVVRDCPYECYWFDLTFYYNEPDVASFYYDSNRNEYYAVYSVSLDFEVTEAYRANNNKFLTNSSKTSVVKKSIKNAQKILSAAAGLSDYEKLCYYRDKIIALVDYDYAAANRAPEFGYGYEGNPWQVIWVFDENPTTNVVCEGYAKAFKYLCDHTAFSHPNIQCYWAKGDFGDGSWTDRHSWNIVHMSNGKNYLVDLTNCDDGGSNVDPLLFMAATFLGNPEKGYWFYDYTNYFYQYDDETRRFYSNEALTISQTPFSLDAAELPKLSSPVLSSVRNSKKGVTLQWDPVPGAEKYRIFRKTSGGAWTRIGLTTNTSYTDTTAVSGTKYYYTARCTDITASVYTSNYNKTGLSITYIAAPVLTRISGSSKGVTLTWKASKGASKYRILRKTPGGSWKKLGLTSSTTYTDKTAVSGKTYYYTVRCSNGSAYTSSYNTTGLKIRYTK